MTPGVVCTVQDEGCGRVWSSFLGPTQLFLTPTIFSRTTPNTHSLYRDYPRHPQSYQALAPPFLALARHEVLQRSAPKCAVCFGRLGHPERLWAGQPRRAKGCSPFASPDPCRGHCTSHARPHYTGPCLNNRCHGHCSARCRRRRASKHRQLGWGHNRIPSKWGNL